MLGGYPPRGSCCADGPDEVKPGLTKYHSYAEEFLADLLRGPMLAHEFSRTGMRLTDILYQINRQIKPSGRHIVGRWVHFETPLGFRIHEKLYELLKF